MQTLTLGSSSLTCTRLAYGCWRLAGSEGGPRLGDSEGMAAVRAAYDAGFTLFDHADIYGRGECERIFGKVLRDTPGMRERIVLATKCGIRPPWDGGTHCYDSSSAHIVASLEGSLKRLGTDFADVLMIHRPDFLGDPEEIGAAFAQLRAQGKVREFGVSNFRPSQLAALQRHCPMPLIVNQVEVSLAALACLDDGTLDQCLAERITPMAWSPLAKGMLFDDPHDERAQKLHALLTKLATERGVSRAAIALAWLLRHPSRMQPIIGSVNPSRIREAVAADAVELTRGEWYTLLTAARGTALP
ncbi:MAG: aldo/keto reductase [Chthoniobacteraceae bacterium]